MLCGRAIPCTIIVLRSSGQSSDPTQTRSPRPARASSTVRVKSVKWRIQRGSRRSVQPSCGPYCCQKRKLCGSFQISKESQRPFKWSAIQAAQRAKASASSGFSGYAPGLSKVRRQRKAMPRFARPSTSDSKMSVVPYWPGTGSHRAQPGSSRTMPMPARAARSRRRSSPRPQVSRP